MSYTLDSYEQGNTYIECRWDKHNGYELIVGDINPNGLVRETYCHTYPTREKVKRAFNRQVKKIK